MLMKISIHSVLHGRGSSEWFLTFVGMTE